MPFLHNCTLENTDNQVSVKWKFTMWTDIWEWEPVDTPESGTDESEEVEEVISLWLPVRLFSVEVHSEETETGAVSNKHKIY